MSRLVTSRLTPWHSGPRLPDHAGSRQEGKPDGEQCLHCWKFQKASVGRSTRCLWGSILLDLHTSRSILGWVWVHGTWKDRVQQQTTFNSMQKTSQRTSEESCEIGCSWMFARTYLVGIRPQQTHWACDFRYLLTHVQHHLKRDGSQRLLLGSQNFVIRSVLVRSLCNGFKSSIPLITPSPL